MNHPSLNGRATASASSESPKERAGSPPQIQENMHCLEQQRTFNVQAEDSAPVDQPTLSCDRDSRSPRAFDDLWKECEAGNQSLLNCGKKGLSGSRAFGKHALGFLRSHDAASPPGLVQVALVLALNGEDVTAVNVHTETDWEWVELRASDSCQVQKESENFKAPRAEAMGSRTVSDSSEDENSDEEETPENGYGICCVGPPPLLAFKPESRQSHLLIEKVPEVVSRWDRPTYLIPCDYCRQPSRPFVQRELLENATSPESLFCCEKAQKMRRCLLEVEQMLTDREVNRRIDVSPHPALTDMQEEQVAKTKQQKLVREKPEPQRAKKTEELKTNKMSLSLSDGISTVKVESQISQADIEDTTVMILQQQETDNRQHRQHKRNHVIMKSYPSGKPFLTLFPDETGNVFYPSGNVAIVISSIGAGDLTYVIREDKRTKPRVQAIFTNTGRSTCYHPNGQIWMNLSPVGGFLFSEMGFLKRRWNWPQHHVHSFQPITLALMPGISIRIHTQQRMLLSFTHRQNTIRFTVGPQHKLICARSDVRQAPDILGKHLQMRRLEIYSLLDRMKTCMAYRSSNPHNIKPQYRLTAHMERLRRQMEKERLSKKTHEAHVRSKGI